MDKSSSNVVDIESIIAAKLEAANSKAGKLASAIREYNEGLPTVEYIVFGQRADIGIALINEGAAANEEACDEYDAAAKASGSNLDPNNFLERGQIKADTLHDAGDAIWEQADEALDVDTLRALRHILDLCIECEEDPDLPTEVDPASFTVCRHDGSVTLASEVCCDCCEGKKSPSGDEKIGEEQKVKRVPPTLTLEEATADMSKWTESSQETLKDILAEKAHYEKEE